MAKKLRLFEPVNPTGESWSPTIVQVHMLTEVEDYIAKVGESFLFDFVRSRINKQSPVSLRVIDWLITRYSKECAIVIDGVNLHQSYNDCLRTHRRSNFDVFRRRNRVRFSYGGSYEYTTIAQLNFLIWAHRIRLFDYATEHLGELEAHMLASDAVGGEEGEEKEREDAREPVSKRPRTSTPSVFNIVVANRG